MRHDFLFRTGIMLLFLSGICAAFELASLYGR